METLPSQLPRVPTIRQATGFLVATSTAIYSALELIGTMVAARKVPIKRPNRPRLSNQDMGRVLDAKIGDCLQEKIISSSEGMRKEKVVFSFLFVMAKSPLQMTSIPITISYSFVSNSETITSVMISPVGNPI